MILNVYIPQADAAFRSGFIARWHKAEGDPVSFGDDLCDVAIDEFMALQRTKRAALLGSTARRRQRQVRDGYDLRDGRGLVHMRLTSSESGVTMGRIMVPSGHRVEIGQLVAILADDNGSVSLSATSSASTRPARIVVNMPDAGEFDPVD